ncbi:hypothetical protein FJT64_027795 [Amphibalanus amphitrite]|uniref:Uncharacterized protein n=1 Tax=Amphibalanus amphitrite TaxID=1232801 RepID=A0A6A4W2E0_AMPAM|nr:hypothetical protein FJT64_027795 [Amphibalanus amphitrite]
MEAPKFCFWSYLHSTEFMHINGHRGIGTWRSAILEELANQAMAAMTQEKVAAAYQHANAFIGACLAREDIWAG